MIHFTFHFLAMLMSDSAHSSPLVVEARLPNASPEFVAASLAIPLEIALAGTPGISRIRSLSMPDRCQLRLTLDPKADRERTRQALALRLRSAGTLLPKACLRHGVMLLPDVDDALAVVAIRGTDNAKRIAAELVAVKAVIPRLERVPHVARAVAVGHPENQMRLHLDSDKLAAYGVSIKDSLTSIATPLNRQAKPAVARLGVQGIEEISSTVVANRNGNPIRLSDVGVLEDGVVRSSVAGVLNGPVSSPAVLVFVQSAPGKAKEVREALGPTMRDLAAQLPAGLALETSWFGPETLTVTLQLPGGTTTEAAERLVRQSAALGALPNALTGCWNTAPNGTMVTVRLKSEETEAHRTAIRSAFNQVPGVAMAIGKAGSALDFWPGDRADFVIRVLGRKADLQQNVVHELAAQMRGVESVVDVHHTADLVPTVELRVDRQKAATLEVAPTDIEEAFEIAAGHRRLAIDDSGRDLVVSATSRDDVAQRSPFDIRRVFVANKRGDRVPLGACVDLQYVASPHLIERDNGRPCNTISCNFAGLNSTRIRAAIVDVARQFANHDVTIEVDSTPLIRDPSAKKRDPSMPVLKGGFSK